MTILPLILRTKDIPWMAGSFSALSLVCSFCPAPKTAALGGSTVASLAGGSAAPAEVSGSSDRWQADLLLQADPSHNLYRLSSQFLLFLVGLK